jgi:hypothetical protein
VTAEQSLSLADRLRCTDNNVIIMTSTFARQVYVQVNVLSETNKLKK